MFIGNLFNLFSSELFLSFFILIQLMVNAIIITDEKKNYPLLHDEIFKQLLLVLFGLLFLYQNNLDNIISFNILFCDDKGIKVIQITLIILFLLLLPLLLQSFRLEKLNFYEYFNLLFLVFLSTLLLVSSTDLITVYLLIELQALSFYVLVAFKRESFFGIEASIKYFFSGAIMSCIFLIGCSILYGLMGTLNFYDLFLIFSIKLNNLDFFFRIGLFLGCFFITLFFLFKLAVIPFHFWAPDVYEGSPLISTIIFVILPKFPIFFIFLKWLKAIGFEFYEIHYFIVFCGIISVTLGSIFAFFQTRIKRFIIFSSIAQIGFLITVFPFLNLSSFVSIYFYIYVYLITSIIIWYLICILELYNFNEITFFNNIFLKTRFLSNIVGFLKFNYLWSFFFVIIFFSYSGIPPFSGFLAKLLILIVLIKEQFLIIALFLILLSCLSVFYYLNIIKRVFFESFENYKVFYFKVLFFDFYLNLSLYIIILLLFIIIIVFFYPIILYMICIQIEALSFFI